MRLLSVVLTLGTACVAGTVPAWPAQRTPAETADCTLAGLKGAAESRVIDPQREAAMKIEALIDKPFVLGGISNRFFPTPYRTLNPGDLDFSAYTRLSLRLSPEKRAQLAEKLRSKASETTPFRDAGTAASTQAALLGLYDRATWLEFIGEVHRGGSDKLRLAWFEELLRKMPSPLREEIVRKISSNYSSARKEMPDRLPPKRSFDWILHRLNPASETLASLEPGSDAYAVYGAYLHHLAEGMHTSTVTRYDQTFMDRALRTVQKYLKEAVPGSVKNREVYLLGSFPNGLGNITHSDFDVWSRSRDMDRWIGTPELNLRLNNLMSGYGRTRPVEISNVQFDKAPGTPIGYLATINPLMFRVTPDRIELLYFSLPKPGKRGYSAETVATEKVLHYRIPDQTLRQATE